MKSLRSMELPFSTNRLDSCCCATLQGAQGPVTLALSNDFHLQGFSYCQTCWILSSRQGNSLGKLRQGGTRLA